MQKTPLTVYRTNTRGIKELVGVCDNWNEVGPLIYGNRDLIDWEATYIVEPEKGVQDEPSGNDNGLS